MKRIRARLQRIADRLTGRRADLAKSRRRHKVWREHAEALDAKAAKRNNAGHFRLGAALERRAAKAHAKARYWKERVRRDDKAIDKLKATEKKLDRELREWLKHVHIEGPNRIRGGTFEQRAHVVQVTAMRNYRNGTSTIGPSYYSMEGGPRAHARICFHYPQGRIYDCSTYNDGQKKVTGDPSPSGPGAFERHEGWTGSELANCKVISQSEAKCGDQVVYLRFHGDTSGHHVETILDPDEKITSGHGDSAINIGCHGSYDLFGDGLFVVLRSPRHDHEHMLPA